MYFGESTTSCGFTSLVEYEVWSLNESYNPTHRFGNVAWCMLFSLFGGSSGDRTVAVGASLHGLHYTAIGTSNTFYWDIWAPLDRGQDEICMNKWGRSASFEDLLQTCLLYPRFGRREVVGASTVKKGGNAIQVKLSDKWIYSSRSSHMIFIIKINHCCC